MFFAFLKFNENNIRRPANCLKGIYNELFVDLERCIAIGLTLF